MPNNSYIFEWMAELQLLAAELIQKEYTIQHKADHTPVTAIDKIIEEFLRDKIQAHFPEDGIIGEEFPPHQPDAARQWVIDPIDGTRALIAGFPTFTTLLALLESRTPQFSTILQPITGEIWYGDGKKTSYNNISTQCTPVTSLAEAVFSTTSPALFRSQDKLIIDKIMQQAASCQLGGDAYAYGKLACGNVHLIIESGMQPYDFLPLVSVVQGAGGIITDWQGNSLTLESNGDVIAASSETLHREALTLLNAA